MTENKSSKGGSSFFQDVGKAFDLMVDTVDKELIQPLGEAALQKGKEWRAELIKQEQQKSQDLQNKRQDKIQDLKSKINALDKKIAYTHDKIKIVEGKIADKGPRDKFQMKIEKLQKKIDYITIKKGAVIEQLKLITSENTDKVIDKQGSEVHEIKVETKHVDTINTDMNGPGPLVEPIDKGADDTSNHQ